MDKSSWVGAFFLKIINLKIVSKILRTKLKHATIREMMSTRG
jgi:hypothetical protein